MSEIAFCFFGQVRFFEVIEIYRKWRNRDPNVNIDMFISTWSDFPYENEFDDFISINMVDVNDSSFNASPYSKVGNTGKMIYHIIEVNKLRRDYELKNKFKYDYVMFVRTDYLLDEDFFFENVFEHTTTELMMNGEPGKCECGLGYGNPNPNPKNGKVNCGLNVITHDYAWMGSPEVMDIFIKEIYNSIELSNRKKIFRHSGHSFFGTTIKRSKLSLTKPSISGIRGLLVRADSDLPVFEKYPNYSSDILFGKIYENRKSMKSWKHNQTPKWGLTLND